MPTQEHHVRHLADRRDRVPVLGDPHGPGADRPVGPEIDLRGGLDLGAGEARLVEDRLPLRRLDEGPDRLFDEIVYTYGIGDAVAEGWLAPRVSKAPHARVDGWGRSSQLPVPPSGK